MTIESLAEALQSVVLAHKLVSDFHREIVAFYELIDSILLETDNPVLEAVDAGNIIRDAPSTMKSSQDWASRWFGRCYYERALFPDEGEDTPPTQEQLRTAFVFIAAAATEDELADFTTPECVFGIAHVGKDAAKVKSFYDAARYGVWNADTKKVVGNDWVETKTPEQTGKFGSGGFFIARRQPLFALRGESDIRTLVTKPLKTKYLERFG